MLLLLGLCLTGCSPLYLPPIPQSVSLEPGLLLAGESRLLMMEGRPRLELIFRRVPVEGWLAFQWFDPSNRQVASDSFWLSPGDVGLTKVFRLPAGVEYRVGEWRVVVSFQGRVIRQFITRP